MVGECLTLNIKSFWKMSQPQLKGRIAFPDSSRQLIAIALKSLGLSANTRASDLNSTTSTAFRNGGDSDGKGRSTHSSGHQGVPSSGSARVTPEAVCISNVSISALTFESVIFP